MRLFFCFACVLIAFTSYLWNTASSTSFNTYFNVSNSSFLFPFGFALSYRNMDDRTGDGYVYFFKLSVYWTYPGAPTTTTQTTTPVTFTTEATTTTPAIVDTTPYGVIIGATIGGVILLAGVIALIV